MVEMKYVHPDRYKNGGLSTPAQIRTRARVEVNCLRCNKFMGAEHDFLECGLPLTFSENFTCPPECRKPFSVVQPAMHIRCNTVSGQTPKEMAEIYSRYFNGI